MAAARTLPDLLSAASLLLAVVAVLFGVWFPEVSQCLEIKDDKPLYWESGRGSRGRVHHAKVTRAWPLAAASVLVAAIFLPESILIILRSARNIYHHGVFAPWRHYDPVETSLVVVVVFAIALAWYLRGLYYQLRDLETDLDRLPKAGQS